MPELPVVAASPIPFSSSDGKYFLIPLSTIYLDASGIVKADRWPLYATYQAIIDPLILNLRSSGVLEPGPEPPHKPAFQATAKTPGTSGIDLEIKIANVVPNKANPPASVADVTISETDTYPGIANDKLLDIIGNAANGGTRPGLVFVSSAAPTLLPSAGNYAMAAANPGDPAKADVPKNGGAGTAFTLQTRDGGPDAPSVAIQIKDVDTAQNTYTLVASWTKTQNAIAISALTAAFAYVVDIKAPPGGFLAPAEGKTTLSGGSDAIAVSPVKASAAILSQ
jgi:hypothetical protein